jgi:molecular chaperone DnaK
VKANDLAAIKSATAELDQASGAMAQHLYKQAGQSQGPTAGPTPEPGKKPGGDDVIDAEYEVKK